MPRMSDEAREVWLFLLNDDGAWTVADLAARLQCDPDRLFDRLSGMAAKEHLAKLPPAPGSRRLRYAVTGTCRVPQGMHVAEVQWPEVSP